MKTLKLLSVLFLGAILVSSCGGDPDDLMVSGIVATGTSFDNGESVTVDLNGATSAVEVPINDLSIVVTFDKAVDVSTVTATSATLMGPDGAVATTATASGSTVTIVAATSLVKGSSHTLTLAGVKADDEGNLPSVTRTFSTEGRAPVTPPNADAQVAYWTFDGVADDETGNYPASDVRAIEFGENRFGEGNSAATFDGDESVIVIPNADRLLANDDFTLAFWMKTNSDGHVNADGNPEGHFVLGLGGFSGFQFEINVNAEALVTNCKFSQGYYINDMETTSEDAFFAGDGRNFENGGWQGWDFQADLTASGGVNSLLGDRWVHVVASYDAAAKLHRLYFDGELMKGHDFNLWPEGSPKSMIQGVAYRESMEITPDLAFGFVHSPESTRWDDTPWGDYDKPTSKHFKGQLDDVRAFSTSFTPAQVKELYDAER